MIIGLTGGIATGKSETAKYFESFGAYNIDADKISREITEVGKPALVELVNALGKSILYTDGTLNRQKLANMIFSNKKIKFKVEKILHSYIISFIYEMISQHKISNSIILVNAPLLFETKLNKICHKTVVIWTPYDVQANRLARRNKLDVYHVKRRIDSQMPVKKKIELADFVIDNSGSKIDLKRSVKNLYKLLTSNIRIE
ncbi:MAG: dephospho-CoA kinase [Endomicrobium sp.]|jgi:dephospho-CoA kinase|nr:dephospho-CoA kinase [Endomicrobium sp.]